MPAINPQLHGLGSSCSPRGLASIVPDLRGDRRAHVDTYIEPTVLCIVVDMRGLVQPRSCPQMDAVVVH